MNKGTGKQVLELLKAIVIGFGLLILSLHLISADNEIFIDSFSTIPLSISTNSVLFA